MDELSVEVVYALPEGADIVALRLPRGATLADAIAASGIPRRHPEVDLASAGIGVYGQLRPASGAAAHGDRIELYRPLAADPKEARRRRALRQKR
jgi:putative ubiquitin-RnfH superfamily antitoxin RatB of RatAB toxin-antitoxin module